MNHLYFGDNLKVMRDHLAAESVDLIYLDPPFNSDQEYAQFFRAPDGSKSGAQIEAFDDTWHWGHIAEEEYAELVQTGPTEIADLMIALDKILGKNDLMAYLVMMASRLVHMHRILKPTGSLYLHCDPTASHYLKLVLDAVFNPINFRGEIIWQRTNARSTSKNWPRLHDTILYYVKSKASHFRSTSKVVGATKLPHTLITGPDGKKYQTFELTGQGQTRDGETGKPWKGFDPSAMGRHWGNNHATMDEWDRQGLIHWPKKEGGFPRRRAESPFQVEDRSVLVGDVWTDIDRLNQMAKERLGYPTQKPISLLERIINASSNPGDVVLDPFCGCGTAVDAAEKLGRNWIGIDITHLAIGLIETRLKDRYPRIKYQVDGIPKDPSGAADLFDRDPYQFEGWACYLVGAKRFRGIKKGADGGIDGKIYFGDIDPATRKEVIQTIIVSVKGGSNIGVGMVRDLAHVVKREKAAMGLFVTLHEPTKPMTDEAVKDGFYVGGNLKKYPKIQILTIKSLMDGTKRPEYPDTLHNPTIKKAVRSHTKGSEPTPLPMED